MSARDIVEWLRASQRDTDFDADAIMYKRAADRIEAQDAEVARLRTPEGGPSDTIPGRTVHNAPDPIAWAVRCPNGHEKIEQHRTDYSFCQGVTKYKVCRAVVTWHPLVEAGRTPEGEPNDVEALREDTLLGVFTAGYVASAHHRPYDGEDDRGSRIAFSEFRRDYPAYFRTPEGGERVNVIIRDDELADLRDEANGCAIIHASEPPGPPESDGYGGTYYSATLTIHEPEER